MHVHVHVLRKYVYNSYMYMHTYNVHVHVHVLRKYVYNSYMSMYMYNVYVHVHVPVRMYMDIKDRQACVQIKNETKTKASIENILQHPKLQLLILFNLFYCYYYYYYYYYYLLGIFLVLQN